MSDFKTLVRTTCLPLVEDDARVLANAALSRFADAGVPATAALSPWSFSQFY